jgi:hypothetical protein
MDPQLFQTLPKNAGIASQPKLCFFSRLEVSDEHVLLPNAPS